MTDYMEKARREDTAKAWWLAWLCQAGGREANRECAAKSIVAARRENTSEAWNHAWFCQPYNSEAYRECDEQARAAARREATAEGAPGR